MVSLKDLQEENIYLRFDEKFKKEFFETFENSFNISILKNFGYKTVNQQWRAYKSKGSFYPLFAVKELCKILERINPIFSIDSVEKHVVSIKSGSRGGYIYNPKLPIKFNDSISRMIAHVLGDGDIHPSGMIRYTNSDISLINSFIDDLKSLGDVKIRRNYDKIAHRIYVPKIVKLFLDELGLKDKTCSFILKLSKDMQAAFVQALFDDEGSVNLSSPRITISSSNRILLDVVKLSLSSNFQVISKIYFSGYYYDRKGNEKSMWNIYITGFRNFEKFYKSIDSKHSEKTIKLDKLLGLYEGKKPRTLRYETRNKILGLLYEKNMTKHDLAKELGLTLNTISSHIRKLMFENRIFRSGRIRISRQNATLWSLKYSNDKWIGNNNYNKFSKTLLEELDKPKDTFYLSRKFHRCKGDVQYFLRRMERENLVKRIVVKHKPHLWSRVL